MTPTTDVFNRKIARAQVVSSSVDALRKRLEKVSASLTKRVTSVETASAAVHGMVIRTDARTTAITREVQRATASTRALVLLVSVAGVGIAVPALMHELAVGRTAGAVFAAIAILVYAAAAGLSFRARVDASAIQREFDAAMKIAQDAIMAEIQRQMAEQQRDAAMVPPPAPVYAPEPEPEPGK